MCFARWCWTIRRSDSTKLGAARAVRACKQRHRFLSGIPPPPVVRRPVLGGRACVCESARAAKSFFSNLNAEQVLVFALADTRALDAMCVKHGTRGFASP